MGDGNVISKALGKINMISLVVWASAVAWPPLLILSLSLEGPTAVEGLIHLSIKSIAALLFIILGSTLYGFATWAWLIHRHPLSKIIPFMLLVPALGLMDSAIILGEPLPWWKIGASLLVILVFALISWVHALPSG